MLLRHTPAEVADRKALTINPAKTCQPIGAMYAALGVHGTLPHSHGSQGCCSYHRSTLTRHFKEPVMAATSSFTEGASVFGGQANMLQAVGTIFNVYNPDIIAVHSTCLSETIGDDLNQILQKAREDGQVPEGKYVLHCNTPSYVGSHVTGFSNMTAAFAKYFAESSGVPNGSYNIISGWIEPSDMREIKRLVAYMGLQSTMLPDTSDVLDAPQTGEHQMYPDGGTTVEQMVGMGDAEYTFALGKFCSEDAAIQLEKKCKVPFDILDVPIGLSATDRFLMALSDKSGLPVNLELEKERGRLVDLITDMQQYFFKKKVALFGDPDILLPLAEFLLDLDMEPCMIISGTPGKIFTKRITEMLGDKVPNLKVKNGEQADMFLLHQWIKNEPVDLIIGNTYGKYIARDEEIPFLRMGFPILDRVGHSYFPKVGYNGALSIATKILDLFLDKKDKDSSESTFELVL
jgi:nitrogenase molybdenum-iron protein beta chain